MFSLVVGDHTGQLARNELLWPRCTVGVKLAHNKHCQWHWWVGGKHETAGVPSSPPAETAPTSSKSLDGPVEAEFAETSSSTKSSEPDIGSVTLPTSSMATASSSSDATPPVPVSADATTAPLDAANDSRVPDSKPAAEGVPDIIPGGTHRADSHGAASNSSALNAASVSHNKTTVDVKPCMFQFGAAAASGIAGSKLPPAANGREPSSDATVGLKGMQVPVNKSSTEPAETASASEAARPTFSFTSGVCLLPHDSCAFMLPMHHCCLLCSLPCSLHVNDTYTATHVPT